KRFQSAATLREVAHGDVDRLETGQGKGGGHLELAVDALLPEDRDFRTRAPGNVRRGDVFPGIEGKVCIETRIVGVEQAVVFLARAVGVVALGLHVPGRLRPGAIELRARGREE